MFGKIDMHVHTGRYDGEGTPIEIVNRALNGTDLSGLVLLDHDMMPPFFIDHPQYGNIAEYGASVGLIVDTAVEITVETYLENVHLLWYNFDFHYEKEIQAYFDMANRNKQEAYQEMCSNLTKNGIPISYDELLQQNPTPSRLDIINSIVRKGYAETTAEAKRILESDANIAYVKRLSIREGIELINMYHGISILAHPLLIDEEYRYKIITDAAEYGVSGYELFYPYKKNNSCYASDSTAISELYSCLKWLESKHKRKFIVTGGSDYHGSKKANLNLGGAYIDINTFMEDFGKQYSEVYYGTRKKAL